MAIDANFFADGVGGAHDVVLHVGADDGDRGDGLHVGFSDKAAGDEVKIGDADHGGRVAANVDVGGFALVVADVAGVVGDGGAHGGALGAACGDGAVVIDFDVLALLRFQEFFGVRHVRG